MDISHIIVRLTEKDLLSIIKENLKIDELKIEDIKIGELIEIEGYYKKGIKLKFKASLGFGNITDNVVKLRLITVKLGIFHIWTRFINFILKKALKNLKSMGITLDKGTVLINFNLLCNYIPYINFVLSHIVVLKGGMEVEIENLVYSESKEANKQKTDNQALSLEELKEKIDNNSDEDKKEEEIKEEMLYSKIRVDTLNKVPDKYKVVAEYTMLIPDFMVLLYRLMKDKRIPVKTRVLMGTVLAYLASPIDIIPDSIPLIGKLDDLGIGFILLDKVIDEIPQEIILENWNGKEEVILKIKQMKNELFAIVGRKKTLKVINGAIIGTKKFRKIFGRKKGGN